MCVHCEWLLKTARGFVLAGDFYETVAANNPRHTPETRAGWKAGAIGTIACQAFFQAIRTRNPAPIDKLLAVCLEWARENLEYWPMNIVNPADPSAPIPADCADLSGLLCPDNRPIGPDPACREAAAKCIPGYAPAGGMDLFRRWQDESRGKDTPPTGKPFGEMAESYAEHHRQTAAVNAPTGEQLAKRLSDLFGIPVEFDGRYTAGTPKLTKKEKKRAKREAKKRKGN